MNKEAIKKTRRGIKKMALMQKIKIERTREKRKKRGRKGIKSIRGYFSYKNGVMVYTLERKKTMIREETKIRRRKTRKKEKV